MNQQNLQKFRDSLKAVHWGFVLKTAGALSALAIFLISLLYFLGDGQSTKTNSEARLALRTSLNGLATFASDYDNDKVLEPPFASDLDGKVTDNVGFFIPPSINVQRTNAQNKPYVYCAWDLGHTVNNQRYYVYKNNKSVPEILANPAPTAILLALVDPGPNGKYETRCDAILTPQFSIGDDIVETLNKTDTEQLATQKVAAPRKNNRNCAFGQIYIWNEVKQQWECKTPAPEQTGSIPAGCPTGQVLVERNKKIRCETVDKVNPEVGEEIPTVNTGITVTDNASNLNQASNGGKNEARKKNPEDSVILPAAAGSQPQNQVAGAANGAPAATTNVTDSTFVDQQSSQILTGPVSNNSNIAQDPNTAIQQKILLGTQKGKARSIRTPSPGESINAAFEEDVMEDSETPAIASKIHGKNLIAGSPESNPQSEEASLEMEIRKRKQKYKLKSCNPWLYLPRSTGVMNQCIRTNAFGDFFGAVARTTSWPAARSFLQGAFLFCPVGNYGEKQPCKPMTFDKNLFVTRTPPSVFNKDGFICARMFNPLPAPWPQFESFIYSEAIPDGARCKYDQVPFIDSSVRPASVMCMNLQEVIDAYTNNGYCGCGWSLIWNAQVARFQCS